jgi:TonB family protein
MKYSIITLFLTLLINSGFSQNSDYYFGRFNPTVKNEELPEAVLISDIIPALWIDLMLPYEDRIVLDNRRKMEYAVGSYLYPLGGYEMIIKYVSVEVSAIANGKLRSSQSDDDTLTTEQKNLINAADIGSDINIKIRFTIKNNDESGNGNEIMEGFLAVTVVPETEAEFPGGFNYLTKYLMENVIGKISDQIASEKIQPAIVKFAINEEGQIVDIQIIRTSTDQIIDKLILDAMHKMPKWSPAKDSKGVKIKQEFNIRFGNNGC